jgi:hypothetical protein
MLLQQTLLFEDIFWVGIKELCTSGEKTTTQQIDNENGIINLK